MDVKEDKEVQKIKEIIFKSLNEKNAKTLQEKFDILLYEHIESERNNRCIQQELKCCERRLDLTIQEKDKMQREYNKNLLLRDKLKEVCREQQKLIKSIKNESMQKIREEEERYKESQVKFQASLDKITQSLTKNNEENFKLRDHNKEMTQKLRSFVEQFHSRELQLEKLNQQVQLESQLNQAKLNKVQFEESMEKEALIRDKQVAIEKLLQTEKVVKELTERELSLKDQINLYTAKYDEFQSSLQKSNEVFSMYKSELDKMSKHRKHLEIETLEWKSKWQKSNATTVELTTEKKERDAYVIVCNKQINQLQKLLRALQEERTHLYQVLRDNQIVCPALPKLPSQPEPIVVTASKNSIDNKLKIETLNKNCAELKETLSSLQNQIKCLNMNQSPSDLSSDKSKSGKKRHTRKEKTKINKNVNLSENTCVASNSDTPLNSNACLCNFKATTNNFLTIPATEGIDHNMSEGIVTQQPHVDFYNDLNRKKV